MKVMWHGTATIEITDGDKRILFDPFVRQNRHLKSTPLEGFCGADAVFITHGHFDHLFDTPALTRADKNVTVYCTKTPAGTLGKKGVPTDRVSVIRPGDKISIGDFNITVYQGKHVVFDFGYIMSVFAKCTVFFPILFKQVYYHSQFSENNEIVIYEIENNGKRVLLMGSYGTADSAKYPDSPDMFVLANGGCVKLPKLAEPFIDEIKPKKVFIDHFDNAFPPLTRLINVKKGFRHIIERHPDIEFIVPTECEPVEV